MEPENNIEMIIKGYLASASKYPLMIIGNTSNNFGINMKNKYSASNIIFPGAIYDPVINNNLRYHAAIYFHGHSVGGTNPSLLEAMACQSNISAHNNIFNQHVLGDDADYFSSSMDIAAIINSSANNPVTKLRNENNLDKIKTTYNWPKIINSYEELMLNSLSGRR